jgi:xanthine/CO dehydrogenase XdhC/CoxF family maturation factor
MVKLLSSGAAGAYLAALPSNAGASRTGSTSAVDKTDGDTSWIGGGTEEDDLAAEMRRSLA